MRQAKRRLAMRGKHKEVSMCRLNELVAVRVMLATTINTLDKVPNGFYVRNRAAYYGDDAGRDRCKAFLPTTSIDDAWWVVEKVREHRMVIEPHEIPGKVYVLASQIIKGNPPTEGGDYPLVFASEDTAPMAITICALRAVGVPEAEIEEARNG
jgi:hypothetical protein